MTDATFTPDDVAPFDHGRLSQRHSTWTIAGAGAVTLGVLVGSWLLDHRPDAAHPFGMDPGAARLTTAFRTPPAPALPDLPTMAESGLPGFQAISWHGIVAPAGTPPAVVDTLNRAFSKALAAPEVRQRLMEEGAEAAAINTGEFGAFIQSEIAAWAEAVKASGASAN